MHKTDINYSNMLIYKICCKDLNIKDIYVGHTTNLIKRRNSHKSKCNKGNCKEYNFKVYTYIRDNGGWDNWSVIEVEKCPCLNFEEACKIERNYIEKLNATLNKVIPTRTDKEYYEDNIDKIKEYKKEWSKKNYEKNKERSSAWYYNNKEYCLEKEKERRKINKETTAQYMKQYYQQKKENILVKMNEKNKCECGCIVNSSSLLTHKKSQKHLKLMEKLNFVDVVSFL
jgi:hypothetical protein